MPARRRLRHRDLGPVTAVVRFDDVDEAIRMTNDTVYGLMANVFGEERHAMAVARRLEPGMVAVNRGVVSDPAATFGGVKQSGLGREGSSEGIWHSSRRGTSR